MIDIYRAAEPVGYLDYGDKFLRLTYREDYRCSASAFPISASLPLSQDIHENACVERYLWNLLPEAAPILEDWQRRYKISDIGDPLSILKAVGQDVPGAFSYYPHGADPCTSGELRLVNEQEIGEDLQRLRTMRYASPSRISLAGAQPKTAYRYGSDGQWYFPTGMLASTHIFKPSIFGSGRDDLDYVEHVLSVTARNLALPAIKTFIKYYAGERSLVSQRFDRKMCADGRVLRLHQEDLAQVLGVRRNQKYEIDGGPGVAQLVQTVRRLDPESEKTLWQILAFNVAIGNADAHAKNFSFLIDEKGHHLAPAYDLVSLVPFPDYDQELAMKIGHQRSYRGVLVSDWESAAKRAKSDPSWVCSLVEQVFDNVPRAYERALRTIDADIAALDVLGMHIKRIGSIFR